MLGPFLHCGGVCRGIIAETATEIKFVVPVAVWCKHGPCQDIWAKSIDFGDVPGLSPMEFYITEGTEVWDTQNLSFYNEAEAFEIKHLVNKMCREWPKQWTPRKRDDIVVVAVEIAQVCGNRLPNKDFCV